MSGGQPILKRKREGEIGRDDDDDRANVPLSMHAAPGGQRLAPTQEACLCYS
jgi:hypothetical protein